jgi:hypothetical protein
MEVMEEAIVDTTSFLDLVDFDGLGSTFFFGGISRNLIGWFGPMGIWAYFNFLQNGE